MNVDTSYDLQCNKLVSFKYHTSTDELEVDERILKNGLRDDGIERCAIKYASNTRAKIMADELDSVSVIINISRSDMDTSILTPNKEFIVKNYEENKQYDGRYLLSYKKEIMTQQGEDFISNVVFGLRKVSE